MRVVKITAIVFAVVVVAVVVILTVGVPSGFLVQQISDQITTETGQKVKISGGATLRILPNPSLVVRDIAWRGEGTDAAQPELTVASARVEVSLADLVRGKLQINEIKLDKPVLRVPQARRAAARAPGVSAKPTHIDADRIPEIRHIAVENGEVLFVRPGGEIKNQFDRINLAGTLTPDHRIETKIAARLGDQLLDIRVNSKAPIETIDKALPLELTLDAPGVLEGQLVSTLDVSSFGSIIKVNNLAGTIGKDRFTGWVSVQLGKKPRVKVDLNFKRLSLLPVAASAKAGAAPSSPDKPWSDEAVDFQDLNFVDANVAFSASELDVSHLKLAPVYVEAALTNGVLNVGISNTGLYGGRTDGLITLNASGPTPRQSVNVSLSNVRAMPLLSALADFHELEGTMRSKIDVQSTGNSARAIMSSLNGTLDVQFRDGAIRNVNVAQMVRSLTQTTLSGWQQKQAEKTDLNELSALFNITSGQAKTDNLKLLGPLVRVNGTGTADLARKTLQFKLDSKLVVSLEGQGGPANPVGFGVPVIVEGKWSAPKIYPDMSGILSDPDAAYSKLHDLGAGLFGSGINLFGGDGNKTGPATETSTDNKNAQAPAKGDQQDKSQAMPSDVNSILNDIFGK